MRRKRDFKKYMNVFPRVVWILLQLTAFVLKLQQKIISGQKYIAKLP